MSSMVSVRTDPFVPLGALPQWTQAMRRGTHAQHTGQLVQALCHFQAALGMARAWVAEALAGQREALALPASQVDARLCAFVSGHRCLAELQTEAGNPDLAAETLAQAHRGLLALVPRHPPASAWHRAAAWHGRDTHAALLDHRSEHGEHPDIDQALRAGCLSLRAGPPLRPKARADGAEVSAGAHA